MASSPPTKDVGVDEIKSRVRDYVLKTLLEGEEPINLTDTTPLVSGGVIDSMNSLKVGLFLERSFGVKLLPEELADPQNLETIDAIAKLVQQKQDRH